MEDYRKAQYEERTFIQVMTVFHVAELQKNNALSLALTKDFIAVMNRYGVLEGAAKQRLLLAVKEGYTVRMLRGAYQLTAKGIELLESMKKLEVDGATSSLLYRIKQELTSNAK